MNQKPKYTSVNKEDSDLFREAMADTRPLPPAQERHILRPAPKPSPRQNSKNERAELLDHTEDIAELETNDQLVFLRAGLNKQVLRKLRRGNYRVEDEIDLHGLTQAGAEKLILEFIEHALDTHFKCIRVIHGKGLRSGNTRPVLKTLCNHLLRRHPAVMAFASAKPANGGTGAVCILLKTSRDIETTTKDHQI